MMKRNRRRQAVRDFATVATLAALSVAGIASAQSPAAPANSSTNLLLIDRFGNAVRASTNEVSPSLYPPATTGFRNQIPNTPPGTPQPEAVRQRIEESKTRTVKKLDRSRFSSHGHELSGR